MSRYSLRPVPKDKSDLRDIYKIFVPSRLYISLRSSAKDLWNLENQAGDIVAVGRLAQASDEVQNKVLQITREFKELFGLNFEETYALKKAEAPLRYATEVILEPSSTAQNHDFWRGTVGRDLLDKLVSPGLELDVEAQGENASFIVTNISITQSSKLHGKLDVLNVDKATRIRIEAPRRPPGHPGLNKFSIDRSGLFGLNAQLDELDYALSGHNPALGVPRRSIHTAILITAAHERTTVVDKISDLPWTNRIALTQDKVGKASEDSLRNIASEASKMQPCLITIDDLEGLLRSSKGFEESLLRATKQIKNQQVLMIAEVQDSSKISSKMLNAFTTTVDIPAPNEETRKALISHHLEISAATVNPAAIIDDVALKTPGYTATDIEQLIWHAIDFAERRIRLPASTLAVDEKNASSTINITLDDFDQARKMVSPSALSEGQLKKHREVHWSDIGGQQETKRIVEEQFEWPLKYPETYKDAGMTPGKGLLLYGPPGCSKTMTALALATEAKLNFIAVKGSELLSKFVGESESNLRAVFTRARSIAPCVIFFDEFDSIASSKDNERTSNVSLVETLLNELDGVDELKGVSVLAATNKPWALDTALLRPGRFDGIVYVKLPDAEARQEIFKIELSKRVHQDINLKRLVEATEGCSGAEVVDFCRTATMNGLRTAINGEKKFMLSEEHFDQALKELRRDTDPMLIARYEEFASRAGRTVG